jgi:hypothetical protein
VPSPRNRLPLLIYGTTLLRLLWRYVQLNAYGFWLSCFIMLIKISELRIEVREEKIREARSEWREFERVHGLL